MAEFCCAHCLSRDAVVQCGHGCGAALYCGQQCADSHYEVHKLICHQPGDPPTFTGTVVVSGNFVMIRLLDMNGDAAFQAARSYVVQHALGWKVEPPHAWTSYNSGPHITLKAGMQEYVGEFVSVQLGPLYHYEKGSKRGVAFHATLPAKFVCQSDQCHVSVAQQRMKN